MECVKHFSILFQRFYVFNDNNSFHKCLSNVVLVYFVFSYKLLIILHLSELDIIKQTNILIQLLKFYYCVVECIFNCKKYIYYFHNL